MVTDYLSRDIDWADLENKITKDHGINEIIPSKKRQLFDSDQSELFMHRFKDNSHGYNYSRKIWENSSLSPRHAYIYMANRPSNQENTTNFSCENEFRFKSPTLYTPQPTYIHRNHCHLVWKDLNNAYAREILPLNSVIPGGVDHIQKEKQYLNLIYTDYTSPLPSDTEHFTVANGLCGIDRLDHKNRLFAKRHHNLKPPTRSGLRSGRAHRQPILNLEDNLRLYKCPHTNCYTKCTVQDTLHNEGITKICLFSDRTTLWTPLSRIIDYDANLINKPHSNNNTEEISLSKIAHDTFHEFVCTKINTDIADPTLIIDDEFKYAKTICGINQRVYDNGNAATQEVMDNIAAMDDTLPSDSDNSDVILDSSDDQLIDDDLDHEIDYSTIKPNEYYKDPKYYFEILKDKSMKDWKWNLNSVRHNQRLDPIIEIVRKYLLRQDKDKEYKGLPKTQIADLKRNRYSLNSENGLIYYRNSTGRDVVYVPKHHRKAIMAAIHQNILAGNHSGQSYSQWNLIKNAYWPGYKKDINEFIKTCRTCQLNKAVRNKRYGLMKLFRATKPNQLISIDHAIMPMTPEGNKYITSIIDNFSGLVYASPMKNIKADNVARLIHDKWITVHGVPDKLLSDLGRELTGQVMKHLCRLCNTRKLQTTSHHPNTNGQIERWNSTMKKGLRVISADKGINFSKGHGWDLFMDLIVGHYNNQVSRRTHLSPNEIFYGKDIILPINYEIGFDNYKPDSRTKRIYRMFIKLCHRIKHNLALNAISTYDRKRKKAFDKDRVDFKFNIGDKVIYLSKLVTLKGADAKINTLWHGPFEITRKYNDGINYTIRHLTKENYTKEVTVDRLKRYFIRTDEELFPVDIDSDVDDLYIEFDDDIIDIDPSDDEDSVVDVGRLFREDEDVPMKPMVDNVEEDSPDCDVSDDDDDDAEVEPDIINQNESTDDARNNSQPNLESIIATIRENAANNPILAPTNANVRIGPVITIEDDDKGLPSLPVSPEQEIHEQRG
ncbi:MAG: transposase family protein, partial [Planctomycetes bacterium]|nr:transposase family protein [Planctomycetota bacterium]